MSDHERRDATGGPGAPGVPVVLVRELDRLLTLVEQLLARVDVLELEIALLKSQTGHPRLES